MSGTAQRCRLSRMPPQNLRPDRRCPGDARVALLLLAPEAWRWRVAFLRHIAHEDILLRPVLADVDAWGPARVEKMDDEHRQQRATIAALTMLDPGLQAEGDLGRIRAFVTEVERDMTVEEREGLSPDVLRDDTIVIDSFTG